MNDSNKIKILIADDDESTRILLRASVTQWGYEVVEAVDGEEAWRLLNEPNPPQILLLDWLMPHLDGIALCNRILKEYSQLRPYIIFVSNLSSQSNILRGIEAGADDFISKPFNVTELHTKIDAVARKLRYRVGLFEKYQKNKESFEKIRNLILEIEKTGSFKNNPQFNNILDIIKASDESK